MVSNIAGTTADPVDTLISWRGTHRVRLIDTAGIWKKAKDHLARAAVIWALRVVQRAHVVIFVVDGTVGVTEHDMHVAGFVLEHMKSVVVAVNKWDAIPKVLREREDEKPKREKMTPYKWQLQAMQLAEKMMEKVLPKVVDKKKQKRMKKEMTIDFHGREIIGFSDPLMKKFDRKLKMEKKKTPRTSKSIEDDYEVAARSQLHFMPFVPFTFISATTGYRVPHLMDLAVEVYHERSKHIKISDMFEILRTASLRHKLPGKGRNLLRVRFAMQTEAFPPTFVFFVNNPEAVPQSYEKFLESCIREKYPFRGTPIRLVFKQNTNKYVEHKANKK